MDQAEKQSGQVTHLKTVFRGLFQVNQVYGTSQHNGNGNQKLDHGTPYFQYIEDAQRQREAIPRVRAVTK